MTTHLTRRAFLATATAASLSTRLHAATLHEVSDLVLRTDRARTIRLADQYMKLAPQTITALRAARSPGSPHDFYSEADYFWPNPDNPSGPYKEIDGKTNPSNFLDHRRAMLAMAMAVPALTAAWLVTHKQAYADRAAQHLCAWFVTPATRMTPNLEYAQAVRQGVTGRSWGIIDTLHLAEVARAITLLERSFSLVHAQPNPALSPAEYAAIHDWFRQYLLWLQTSKKGIAERDAANNHATAWALQAAEFARLIKDWTTRNNIQQRYETILIQQMAPDGSYPRELHRTKPYGYSIFNFDVMAGLTWSLSREQDTRWTEPKAAPAGTLAAPQPATPEAGRGMCLAAQFLYPYLKDKSTWPYPPDIQHFESWPVRSPGLLFCGIACKRTDYIDLWKTLPADPEDKEVNRNFPIRQPLLWM
jgi:hypothetical protein